VCSTTLTQAGVIADVTVTPGHVGQNEIHLVITPPGGSIDPVVSTSVQAQSSDSAAVVPANMVILAPNHYTGTITLGKAGDWTLQVSVEPAQGQSVVMTAVVPIPG